MTYYVPKFGEERRVRNEVDLYVVMWTEAKVVEVRKQTAPCNPISAKVCVSPGEGSATERAEEDGHEVVHLLSYLSCFFIGLITKLVPIDYSGTLKNAEFCCPQAYLGEAVTDPRGPGHSVPVSVPGWPGAGGESLQLLAW